MSSRAQYEVPPHPPLPEYYQTSSREKFVRRLFDETAPWYERINSLLSFGSGGWYRRDALRRAGIRPGMKHLDVATGTGVTARAGAALGANVIGLDPSLGMLLAGRREGKIRSVQAVGESLPFPDGAFEVLSIGYALRHLADLRGAFEEYRRVIRPGGKIVILEITAPRSRIARAALRVYMNGLVPPLVRLLTGNRETATLMRYYWETIEACVPPETILSALRDAGFGQVQRSVRGGVMSDYTGVRP
jgi:demethylmenaquinone methyltransferase/2-methoxy-6-polyprenyl-1,4-benzoquinol methylase